MQRKRTTHEEKKWEKSGKKRREKINLMVEKGEEVNCSDVHFLFIVFPNVGKSSVDAKFGFSFFVAR